jgi:hypothetical protein
MRQVRNAMTAALSGGASAPSNVHDGGEQGSTREADFRSLLGVEERGTQTNQRSEADVGMDEEGETSRRSGVDQALAELAGQERQVTERSMSTPSGRMERAVEGHEPSARPAAQEPASQTAGEVAKSGKPLSSAGAPAKNGGPDSFASSIRSGAFRGQTTSGSKGVRAWAQAWHTSTAAANQADSGAPAGGVSAGAAGMAAMADAAGPLPLGQYLRGVGRVRGENPGRAGHHGRAVDGSSAVNSGPGQDRAAAATGPRSWAEVLRAQGTPDLPAPTAAGEGTPAALAPALATPAPQPGEAFTLAPGGVAPATPTVGAATVATAARPAQAPLATGGGFAMTDPGAAENGMRIRVPTAHGETVRGRMYMDSDTRTVRVVLAVQEGNTAQSMSSAHEMLRLRLADEGYQLQSFIVRHDGRSVVRFEDELPAHLAGDGGRDADGADPRDGEDSRARNRRGRSPQEPIAQAMRPEHTVASGWFL